jgi:hypothetical protein
VNSQMSSSSTYPSNRLLAMILVSMEALAPRFFSQRAGSDRSIGKRTKEVGSTMSTAMDVDHQEARAPHARDPAANPCRRRLSRRPVLSQSRGRQAPPHRWDQLVRQALPQHGRSFIRRSCRCDTKKVPEGLMRGFIASSTPLTRCSAPPTPSPRCRGRGEKKAGASVIFRASAQVPVSAPERSGSVD